MLIFSDQFLLVFKVMAVKFKDQFSDQLYFFIHNSDILLTLFEVSNTFHDNI